MATALLSILVCLFPLVHGTSTNSSYPSSESEGTTRSVWDILVSCMLTLLICIWRTLHPDIPNPGKKWYRSDVLMKRMGYILLSFFAPEMVVLRAAEEWCWAHRKVNAFRDQGYEWSMTHSHFAEMGGFAYRDGTQDNVRIIDSNQFLALCKAGRVSDPLLTEKEIKDKSKSDALGKAIFAVQLFWFMLQVVVRGSSGLAVTLVELDTVSMAVLAVVYLFFWWDKPLRPECPHVFRCNEEQKVYLATELSSAWKSETGALQTWISSLVCKCVRNVRSIANKEKAPPMTTHCLGQSKARKWVAVIEKTDPWMVGAFSLLITWTIVGALHLIAWNFEFPTEAERTMWRGASLILTVSPPVLAFLWGLQLMSSFACDNPKDVVMFSVLIVGTVFRVQLVVLMIASLRALPSSAFETVSWTSYVPHL